MIISKSFQGNFFGNFVKELFDKNHEILIPDLVWEDGNKCKIVKYEDYYDTDKLRWYLKIFDFNYPKYDNGEPYSLRDVDSKVVTNHIEYFRLVLAENGKTFASDDKEWELILQQYNR